MGGPSARSTVCTAKHATKEFTDGPVPVCLVEVDVECPKRENVDLVRESVRLVLQELIDAEAIAVIGADRYERPDRLNERNGTRARKVMIKGGTGGVQSRSSAGRMDAGGPDHARDQPAHAEIDDGGAIGGHRGRDDGSAATGRSATLTRRRCPWRDKGCTRDGITRVVTL